ncbi:hypothetical protein BCV71DRAFT_284902 [Rhizopus microsporus]|uniref:Uncharacterized protein n=1 Tax=Rhizopus microsporus TaxID=58291 RepID=A0A1X0S339_RHIZD|nr:hypothetical protein BCV71DRAFT_284902 [Rhizopus microsporus]
MNVYDAMHCEPFVLRASILAQWQRAGLITRRSVDRNNQMLAFSLLFCYVRSLNIFIYFFLTCCDEVGYYSEPVQQETTISSDTEKSDISRLPTHVDFQNFSEI